MTLSSGTFELANGATIVTAASSTGDAGNVSITAGAIAVDNNGGAIGVHGIIADAFSASVGAHAGQVTLQAASVSVTQGAEISRLNWRPMAPREASRSTAARLPSTAGQATTPTGLFATSLNTGSGGPAAGSISITGTSLQIFGGAVAAVDTAGRRGRRQHHR